MTNDIRRFETKTFGFFTTRQVVCLALGLLIAFPVGLLIPFSNWTNRLLCILIVALPFGACGWVKLDHCYLEFIVGRWLYNKVLTPPKRKKICDNPYKTMIKEYDNIVEKRKLSKMSLKEQKQYKEKKAKIVYSKKKEYKEYY